MAPSIFSRLLIHPVLWASPRAFTKFGIARVASIPIIATTIMISISVNPLRTIVLFFIWPFVLGDVNEADGGLMIMTDFVHELPLPTARGLNNGHQAKLRCE